MLGKLSGRGPTGLRPFFLPLFTRVVRGTGLLASSHRPSNLSNTNNTHNLRLMRQALVPCILLARWATKAAGFP